MCVGGASSNAAAMQHGLLSSPAACVDASTHACVLMGVRACVQAGERVGSGPPNIVAQGRRGGGGGSGGRGEGGVSGGTGAELAKRKKVENRPSALTE